MKKIADILIVIIAVLLCFVVLALRPLKPVEADEYKYYCTLVGFETLFVDDSTDPKTYYCLDLPGIGEVGIIIQLPDIEILRDDTVPGMFSDG